MDGDNTSQSYASETKPMIPLWLYTHQVIAELAEESDLEMGRIYPPLANIHEVSTNLAAKIVEYAYANNIACTYPEPVDKLAFVRAHQFSLEYESFVPQVYSWPQQK